jgi:hypothetical protein
VTGADRRQAGVDGQYPPGEWYRRSLQTAIRCDAIHRRTMIGELTLAVSTLRDLWAPA